MYRTLLFVTIYDKIYKKIVIYIYMYKITNIALKVPILRVCKIFSCFKKFPKLFYTTLIAF